MLNKFSKLFAILFAIVFIVSCSDDSNEPSKSSEAQTLIEYLEVSDYINNAAPAMIAASDVKAGLPTNTVYVIDIRNASDYANGHIPGAVNVALADLLDHLQGMDATQYDKIAIACYSGQTASYGTSLMRLMGYDNVYTLKFGMCSWSTETCSSWPNSIGNTKRTVFTSDVTEKGPETDLPELSTGESTGATILEARVREALTLGFGEAKIANSADFSNSYVVNYWKNEHYLDPGHLPGAIQYTPKADLKLDTYLKTLPTDKQVVVYCYTGQTSAHVAAFLRVMGYDAKSLLYGANGMIFDEMDGKEGFTVWHDTYCMGYDLEK